MNSVNITGRIGNDIEVRYTGSGKAVLNLSVAIRDYNKTVWARVVVWDAAAENVAKYCSKGSMIGVTGRLDTNKYTNNDGQEIENTEVVAITVDFLDSKPKQGGQTNNDAAASNAIAAPASQQLNTAKDQSADNPFEAIAAADNPFASNEPATDISDDDLPF